MSHAGNQGLLNALLYCLGPSSIGLAVEVTGTINRGCNKGINRTCTSVVLIRLCFLPSALAKPWRLDRSISLNRVSPVRVNGIYVGVLRPSFSVQCGLDFTHVHDK